MTETFLFISLTFLLTFGFGKLLERVHVPWLFGALVFGIALTFWNPFTDITDGPTFTFLAELGMYLLLFIIGFAINLKDFRQRSGFIMRATVLIILSEGILGGLLIRAVFGYSWFISFLAALSFATVGEAILIPILDEFNLVNTKFGQTLIGIGALDDFTEIAVLIALSFLISTSVNNVVLHIGVVLLGLVFLLGLTASLLRLKHRGQRFRFSHTETLFLFTLFVLFLYVGIGSAAEAAPLAALLAGVAIRTFIPPQRLKYIENELKTMAYGFFAPLFFVWAGASMDSSYLTKSLILIVLVVLVSGGAKLASSVLIGKKELGTKLSLLLGVGLSVRFSTSIIVVKILFDQGLIGANLYSVMIASTVLFTFFVPILFSQLSSLWLKPQRTP